MAEIASVNRDIIFEIDEVGETFLEGINGERTFFEVMRYVVNRHQWFQGILAIGREEGLASDQYHEEFLRLYQSKYDFLSFLMTLWRMNTIGLKLRKVPETSELLAFHELLPQQVDNVITYRGLVAGDLSETRPVEPLALDCMLAYLAVEIEFLIQKGYLVPVRIPH